MRLPENCYTVFVGNSHIECAINDTILKNSFNFGRSAEQMEFIYCKVKLLKKYNVNRISLGVQSFQESTLKELNRKHTKEDVFKSFNGFNFVINPTTKSNDISSVNFDNFSMF